MVRMNESASDSPPSSGTNGNGHAHAHASAVRTAELVIPTPAAEPPVHPRSAISEAIRKEIMDIATAGDRRAGGAFTADVALRIGRIVRAGRDLLMSERLSAMDIEQLMRRKSGMGDDEFGLGGPVQGAGESIYVPSGMGMAVSGMNVVTPYASSVTPPLSGATSPTENFGMQAMMQIVEAAKAANHTPEKIVKAIAAAKEANMPELVEQLKRKLFADLDSIDPATPQAQSIAAAVGDGAGGAAAGSSGSGGPA